METLSDILQQIQDGVKELSTLQDAENEIKLEEIEEMKRIIEEYKSKVQKLSVSVFRTSSKHDF